MLPDLLGLAAAAAVLAVPFAFRRLRRPAAQAPGAAAVPPARRRPARRTAVPAAVQPSGSPAEPFAYDNGVITGEDGRP